MTGPEPAGTSRSCSPTHHDTRPLAILGASALDVDAELSDVVKVASHGGALAIGACVLAADERIRAGVLGILKRGLTQVTVWGQDVAERIEP